MSFLYDPPALVATGVALERLPIDPELRDRLGRLTVATFVGVSVGLWLNAPGARHFARPFGAASGRDFMITSGLGSRRVTEVPAIAHLAAAGIFAGYPLFLALGRRIGRTGRSHE